MTRVLRAPGHTAVDVRWGSRDYCRWDWFGGKTTAQSPNLVSPNHRGQRNVHAAGTDTWVRPPSVRGREVFQLLNKFSMFPLGFSLQTMRSMPSPPRRTPIVWLSMGLFSFLSFSFWGPSPAPNDHTLVNSALRLRPATSADLDEITALGLASLHDDPVWPYRFSGATAHPDDHYKYSRIRFSEYLDNVEAGVYQSMVVEVPATESAADPAVPTIIAFSMWSLPESWRPPKDSGRGAEAFLYADFLFPPCTRSTRSRSSHPLGAGG